MTGHRRSKSTDERIRRLGSAASTDEILSVTDRNATQHTRTDADLNSFTESGWEHGVGSERDQKTSEALRQRNHDSLEVDTGDEVKESSITVDSADNELLHSTHQYRDDKGLELVEGTLEQSETLSSFDQETISTMNRSHFSEEIEPTEPTVTQLEVPTVVTCVMSEHPVVDRSDRSIAETGWEKRWAMVANTDLTIDYSLLDIVEKIRLRMVGNDYPNPDELLDVEDRPKDSAGEQNDYSVPECSMVISSEQTSGGNDGDRCVQFSNLTPELQCESTAFEIEAAVGGHNTCSITAKDEVLESGAVVTESHNTQDIPSEAGSTCTTEMTSHDRVRTNIAGDVPQRRKQ